MKQSEDVPGWVWILAIGIAIVLVFLIPLFQAFFRGINPTNDPRTKNSIGLLILVGSWTIVIFVLLLSTLVGAVVRHFRKPRK